MGDLRDLITSDEKRLIEQYIRAYAPPSESDPFRAMASVDKILLPWKLYKEVTVLKEIFKDKLIIFEDIKFKTPQAEIHAILCNNKQISKFERIFHKWIWTVNDSMKGDNNDSVIDGLWTLISHYTISKNKYDGRTFRIPTDDGHEIIVPYGCKPVKILGKLNNAFHIASDELFESYRVAVSMALNTASIKGKLCLSIHPLDYMTMSDNDCNWDSCMSWMDKGSYCQGTVEMMNSPYIVVAYLAASTPMKLFDQEWNNKKWRSLYIVHPDFITSIKGYPYQIPEVDKIVVNKLKDLVHAADPNLEYGEVVEYTYPKLKTTDNRTIRFTFHTDHMYNDFGLNSSTHCGCVSKNISDDVVVNYSGESECMWCGSTIFDEDDGDLTCGACFSHTYCACCGEPWPSSALYEVAGGDWVCEDCIKLYYELSFANEMYYPKDDMSKITVIPHELKEAIDNGELDLSRLDPYDAPGLYDNSICYNFSPECTNDIKYFENTYLKEGAHINFYEYESGIFASRYFAYIFDSDFEEDRYTEFCYYLEDSNQHEFHYGWKRLKYLYPTYAAAEKWLSVLSSLS